MPWNSIWPTGTVSVKANRTTGNQNTSYIETTMGNSVVGTNTAATRDHFWNVGANEDGRHRFMNLPKFTVGGLAADPVIGTGMDGVLYIREVNSDVARVEGFYKNTQGKYQYIPSFKSGTITFVDNSTFILLTDVPKNVYGEIYIYSNTSQHIQQAVFVSGAIFVRAYSLRQKAEGTSDDFYLEFANNANVDLLNIKVRRTSFGAPDADWDYRVTYRAK